MFLSNEYMALVTSTWAKWQAAHSGAHAVQMSTLLSQSADAFFDARESEEPVEEEPPVEDEDVNNVDLSDVLTVAAQKLQGVTLG